MRRSALTGEQQALGGLSRSLMEQEPAQRVRHFKPSASVIGLAAWNPEHAPFIIQIAHLTIENLARTQAEDQLGVGCYRPLLASLCGAQQHLGKPPCLVNTQLLLADARLADGLDFGKRIDAYILTFYGPTVEQLGTSQKLPVSLNIHHPLEPRNLHRLGIIEPLRLL
jgi:hypothetical protein